MAFWDGPAWYDAIGLVATGGSVWAALAARRKASDIEKAVVKTEEDLAWTRLQLALQDIDSYERSLNLAIRQVDLGSIRQLLEWVAKSSHRCEVLLEEAKVTPTPGSQTDPRDLLSALSQASVEAKKKLLQEDRTLSELEGGRHSGKVDDKQALGKKLNRILTPVTVALSESERDRTTLASRAKRTINKGD